MPRKKYTEDDLWDEVRQYNEDVVREGIQQLTDYLTDLTRDPQKPYTREEVVNKADEIIRRAKNR